MPGDELLTRVLPDNKTLSRMLEKDWFTERLFTPWKVYSQSADLGCRRLRVTSTASGVRDRLLDEGKFVRVLSL